MDLYTSHFFWRSYRYEALAIDHATRSRPIAHAGLKLYILPKIFIEDMSRDQNYHLDILVEGS